MCSVVIADDMPVVRVGVRASIEGKSDFSIVAEAGSGKEAVACLLKHKPKLALLDHELGDMNSIEIMEAVAHKLPNTKFVVITGTPNILTQDRIVRSGVDGLVSKGSDVQLVDVLKRILSGKTYIEPEITQNLLAFNQTLAMLNTRERAVALMMAQSFSNEKVAEALKITTRSVSNNRSKVRDKLGNRGLDRLKALCKTALLCSSS